MAGARLNVSRSVSLLFVLDVRSHGSRNVSDYKNQFQKIPAVKKSRQSSSEIESFEAAPFELYGQNKSRNLRPMTGAVRVTIRLRYIVQSEETRDA